MYHRIKRVYVRHVCKLDNLLKIEPPLFPYISMISLITRSIYVKDTLIVRHSLNSFKLFTFVHDTIQETK